MFEPTESLTRGQRALQACRFDEAQRAFASALEHAPYSLDALRGLGFSLFQLRDLSASLRAVERALSVDPSDLLSRLLMGRLCLRLQQPALAESNFKAILQRIPDSEAARSGLIDAQVALGDLAAAHAICEPMLRATPHSEVGHLAAARLAWFERDDTAALLHFETLVRLFPRNASHVYNRGLCLLRMGRLEQGWTDYERRFDAGAVSLQQPLPSSPRWEGGPVDRLLVVAEQGLGDTILFSRFLPEAARRAGRLVFACQGPLAELLGRSLGIECVADEVHGRPDHDAHLPLMSLPFVLGLAQATDPRPAYLASEPARRARWASCWTSEPESSELRIGIVQATSVAHSTEENPFTRRSCPAQNLKPLTELPGVTAYSLGVGPVGQDALARLPGLRPLPASLDDFDDTAAAIDQLDAVVCVDTAAAHLAAALGKPVWVLLPPACDWRWQPWSAATPWYESARRVIGGVAAAVGAPGAETQLWTNSVREILQTLKGPPRTRATSSK